MTSFTEDKLFKNINDEDVQILMDIINVSSDKVKIWTKELRLLDPKDYRPDILLELDFENLILELQSTVADDEFSKRGLTYVAVANRDNENGKEVNLMVLSTAEESKTVYYKFNKRGVFTYDVVNLGDLDSDEIISTVEPKILKELEIGRKELVLYALIPMIIGENMEKYIKRVVHNLLQAKATESVKNLVYGIEWLIIDKFMEDEEYRQILCDRLGEKMKLIYEYGERREQKGLDEGMKQGLDEGIKQGLDEGIKQGLDEGMKQGIREILNSFINSGTSLTEISQKTGKSIKELKEILNG